MKSVLQDWVMELPLRYQGVLVASVRGCDGKSKEDPSKPLSRGLRLAFLNPADVRETRYANAFMTQATTEHLRVFLKDIDSYPMHWLMHFAHAAQIVGYCHPSDNQRSFWLHVYESICEKMHVNPESETQMRHRLTKDRLEEVAVGRTCISN